MEKCGLQHLLQSYNTKRPQVIGVGGEMRVMGRFNLLPASLNKNKFVFPCQVVKGLVTPLLLGIDFLSNFCTRVNLYEPEQSLDKVIISSEYMQNAYNDVIKDIKNLSQVKTKKRPIGIARKLAMKKHKRLQQTLSRKMKLKS